MAAKVTIKKDRSRYFYGCSEKDRSRYFHGCSGLNMQFNGPVRMTSQ